MNIFQREISHERTAQKDGFDTLEALQQIKLPLTQFFKKFLPSASFFWEVTAEYVGSQPLLMLLPASTVLETQKSWAQIL